MHRWQEAVPGSDLCHEHVVVSHVSAIWLHRSQHKHGKSLSSSAVQGRSAALSFTYLLISSTVLWHALTASTAVEQAPAYESMLSYQLQSKALLRDSD